MLDTIFGINTGQIIALILGIIVGAIIWALFRNGVTNLSNIFLTKDEKGNQSINLNFVILALLVVAIVCIYYATDLSNYFKTTTFLPVFVGYLFLYTIGLIFYFRKLDPETQVNQKFNFLFFFLLSIGVMFFMYSNDFIATFYLKASQIFIIEMTAFILAFFIFYKKINSSNHESGKIPASKRSK